MVSKESPVDNVQQDETEREGDEILRNRPEIGRQRSNIKAVERGEDP